MAEITIFASDIGLAPGVWPPTITWGDVVFTKTTVVRDRDRDITYVRYFAGAQELRIIND